MSTYRAVGRVSNEKDSPSLASRGTQRSNISLSKVEPLIDSEYLELISNPGSAKGSRNVGPTPPLGKEIQAFKPAGNGLLNFGNDSFSGMENVNVVDSEGQSALHRAVRVGDVGAVVSLLDNGADINLSGKSGLTPLHAAVRFERVKIVKLLLGRGADPFKESDNQLTPLHSAARRGLKEICSLLLKDSAIKVTYTNDKSFSPFHLACLGGDRETCELFLANGADIMLKSVTSHTPLHLAAWQGHDEICELLIETASKKQYSVEEFVNEKDHEGKTALHYSCTRGHLEVVDVLLRHNADRDVVDWLARTSPLHLSAKHGHLTLVQLLILYGAVIDGRDGSLRTPLHSAAALNHGRIVEVLLENGADPEAKDMLAMTPFLIAVTNGAGESVNVLLVHGARITATDSLMNSCLHLAVIYRKAEIVKMLLERDTSKVLPLKDKDLKTVFHLAAGLEDSKILEILLQEDQKNNFVNEPDVNEKAPLHIAAEHGSLRCVDILSNCPKMLNDRDELGLTALHLAASHKHTKTCELLISKGSDVTYADGNGCTALHLAVKAGSLNTVKILLNRILPSTLEQKDYNKNTPLHVACMHNRRDILKFLLDNGADVTARNDRNMTCLEIAIEWEAGEVAKTLMRHPRWEEVLESSNNVCPMQLLIEKLPDVAEIVLDQCVSYSPLPPSHEDFTVKFNFIPLDPDVNAEYDKYFGPVTMAMYRREKLLNHKVTQALLRWKWMILGKFVNILNTAVFAVFVILFTLFVVKEREKVNFSFIPTETTTIAKKESKSTFARTVPYVIALFLVIELIKEVAQAVSKRLSYFKDYTNLLDLAMFVLVWIFILPFMIETDLYSMKTQWTAGVVGLLLCYINLTLSLRRFGGLGLYVTMYVEVLFTFLKVISTFLIGLTGYSLAFYILLQEQGNFSDFWFSLAKIHVMMIGELDYTNMLVENIVNNHTVPGTNVPYVPLPALTFSLFVAFALMVSIVLVNLLVGLAVGDIEAIRETAKLRALIDQVFLVHHIMKSYPRFILRRIHRSYLEIKPNQNNFVKRVAFAGTELSDWDFMDKLMSQKMGASSTEEWCQQAKQMQDERQEERFQKLQATVEAQGKLLQAMADRLKITV